MPIALAGLGGLWSERAGVVNIGLEGMMILGTFGAGWVGYQYGPWAGRARAASSCGALGGLLHAVATVTFGVDHIVSGVAINILGLGVTQFLASIAASSGAPGGGSDAVAADPARRARSPCPASRLGWTTSEKKHWFFVSDVAGIVARADDEPVLPHDHRAAAGRC